MNIIDNTEKIHLRELIFCHNCCSDSHYALINYCKQLKEQGIKDIDVKQYSYFNVHSNKLNERFGFTMEDLKKYGYIYDVDIDTLFKFDNVKKEIKDESNG